MTEEYDPVYSTVENKESTPVTGNKGLCSKSNSDFDFAADIQPEMLFSQQEDSLDSQIPELYAVVDKTKKSNRNADYAVVDKSKKSHKKVPSPLELNGEDKLNDGPLSNSSSHAAAESTFSVLSPEFSNAENGLQKKMDYQNGNEPRVPTSNLLLHSKQKLWIRRNKFYVLSFVTVIFIFAMLMVFTFLAFLSFSQLSGKQESCSNNSASLEELLSTYLDKLSPSTSQDYSRVNTTNVEELLKNYLNRFSPNDSCTLTCTYTTVESVTSMPTTSAPTTIKMFTMSPEDIGYCSNNYSTELITSEAWETIVELNMTKNASECPINFTLSGTGGLRTCISNQLSRGCSSIFFPITNTLTYSKILGRVQAFQFNRTNSFKPYNRESGTIDEPYVDGVSLTYGQPRQHIWTFAADLRQDDSFCPCGSTQNISTPEFVGNDYFCDSGVRTQQNFTSAFSNPLWDGFGCDENYECCDFNSPPWFCKQLPNSTSEPIELRVCRDQGRSNEDIAIEAIYIYVQK